MRLRKLAATTGIAASLALGAAPAAQFVAPAAPAIVHLADSSSSDMYHHA